MAQSLLTADTLGWNPIKHFLNQVSSLRNVVRTVVCAGQHFFEIASGHVVQLLDKFDLGLVDLIRHLQELLPGGKSQNRTLLDEL